MSKKPLLEFNQNGIYCAQGDFYIDPWRPVKDALITHAHSDHAKWGHQKYLAHHLSKEILYHRLGNINLETIEYGKTINKNGVNITLYPAGHIPGSAQIKIEYKGEIWVVSGDYKLEDDGLCAPFEAIKCHSFISECTFGMPVYQWKPQIEIFDGINAWWQQNQAEGKTSVLAGYSLGKAQRILQNLDLGIGKVYAHGAIQNSNDALIKNGIELKPTTRITFELPKEDVKGNLIICPPSAVGTPWLRKFGTVSIGYCSGWMAIRGAKKRRAVDRGFILSDHADWDGLITAIAATECETVYLTHGYTASFSRYLEGIGYDAREAKTLYGNDEEEVEVSVDEADKDKTEGEILSPVRDLKEGL